MIFPSPSVFPPGQPVNRGTCTESEKGPTYGKLTPDYVICGLPWAKTTDV